MDERVPAGLNASAPSSAKGFRIIFLIALFKLLKAVLLAIVAVGALSLVNRDIAEKVGRWVAVVHVDPDNRYIQKLMTKLTTLDPRRLEAIGAGTIIYAAIFTIEGIGLLMRKRWAQYLTVVTTALLIPLEIYEVFSHTKIPRIVLLIVNTAIVWYLARRLAHKQEFPGATPVATDNRR
ncbi:MAG: DUF2127 domain-containing protein [Bacteroidota bacterium]|jgi:uncharacterized membrane protein (DUF2068 family)